MWCVCVCWGVGGGELYICIMLRGEGKDGGRGCGEGCSEPLTSKLLRCINSVYYIIRMFSVILIGLDTAGTLM